MDITQFAIGNRDSALLIGDYNAYRSQLSRQLLAVRKRLGRATAKNAKFQAKAAVTAENIGQNHEYVESCARDRGRLVAKTAADMRTFFCCPRNEHGLMPCT